MTRVLKTNQTTTVSLYSACLTDQLLENYCMLSHDSKGPL